MNRSEKIKSRVGKGDSRYMYNEKSGGCERDVEKGMKVRSVRSVSDDARVRKRGEDVR